MDLVKLIVELGKELAVETSLAPASNGHYLLSFDPGIEVNVTEEKRIVLFKGIIGSIPETNTESFLLGLMEANLFGLGTRGAAIGLEAEGKLLTLSQAFSVDISFEHFKEKLEDFVSVIAHWRQAAAG